MIDETMLMTLTQFGAAGLIGVLWLYERRQAAARERQLDEAHRRVVGQERELEALLRVVQDNTRAMSALEASQRRLVALLSRFTARSTDRTRIEP